MNWGVLQVAVTRLLCGFSTAHLTLSLLPGAQLRLCLLSDLLFLYFFGEAAAKCGTTPSWSRVNSHPQFLSSVLFWQMTRRQSPGHAMKVVGDCPL